MEGWKLAGKTLEDLLRESRKHLTTDLQLAEWMERETVRRGAIPAFPVNVSMDEEAAHATPGPEREIEGVVKVDYGVCVDGYLSDAAYTVDLSGEWGKLVEAAREALENALSVIRAGVEVRAVGRVIEETAKKYGFRTVKNLGGHELRRWRLHSGFFLPNYPYGSEVIREGMVLAVEPFVTAGKGYVEEGKKKNIFSVEKRGCSRLLDRIYAERKGLPFADRWYGRRSEILRCERLGFVRSYPVLVDNGPVAQFETTVRVEKDGVEVIVDIL